MKAKEEHSGRRGDGPGPKARPRRTAPTRPAPGGCSDSGLASKGRTYSRERHLRTLVPLWPEEAADVSAEGTRRIIARLRRALRIERSRGLAGHWAYDVARHLALVQALKAELASLGRASPSHRGAARYKSCRQAER